MFKRILVPLDGSVRSLETLGIARELALYTEARVTLLRVEPVSASLDTIERDREQLRALAAGLRREGVNASALIEHDRTEEGIAVTAKDQRSDLVIMAPRHRGLLGAILHPSVTARLFSRSPTPLLIWPEQQLEDTPKQFLATPTAIVIVPLDGSPFAEQALPLATMLAKTYERALVLVRVAPRITLPGAGPEALILEAEAQHDENQKALRYLKRVRQRLVREGVEVPVQTMLRVSYDPGQQLLTLAETHHDSIMVLCTHGHGYLGPFPLGSVATKIMSHTSVPVLVVPPTASPAASLAKTHKGTPLVTAHKQEEASVTERA